MKVSEKHPDFVRLHPQWIAMRDFYEGEDRVKEKGTVYLEPTVSMELDGMAVGSKGYKKFQKYKNRSVFPGYIEEAADNFVGIMHEKPPNIELPASMEDLRYNATVYGESLNDLLRRINFEQILTGRLGLFADFESGPNLRPHIDLYVAESIINWHQDASSDNTKLGLVVFDESGYEFKDFQWKWEESYRVFQLGLIGSADDDDGLLFTGEYSDGDFDYSTEKMYPVSVRGEQLDKIPFVFINTMDIIPDPSKVPLKELGNVCLAIYRGEADYRQTLFMQGQDTLTIIGGDAEKKTRIGADAVLHLEEGADAKYVGVSSSGLPYQEQAISNDRKQAESMAATLISPHSGEQESGYALTKRIAAQTASLNQIALAGAKGLEETLKNIASYTGADPDEVSVEPNLEFSAEKLSGTEMKDYMIAKSQGAPISMKSIHSLMVRRGISEMTYEEELQAIEEEFGDGGIGEDGDI